MNVQALVNISIEPKEMRSWEGGFAQITVGQSRFQSGAVFDLCLCIWISKKKRAVDLGRQWFLAKTLIVN